MLPEQAAGAVASVVRRGRGRMHLLRGDCRGAVVVMPGEAGLLEGLVGLVLMVLVE